MDDELYVSGIEPTKHLLGYTLLATFLEGRP
ncbi:hypothetical protein SAMN04488556_0112, partial [Halostagnicola kamekurae]